MSRRPVTVLGECHRQILIPAGEASQSRIAGIACHTTAKLAIGQETEQLREDGAALVHAPLCRDKRYPGLHRLERRGFVRRYGELTCIQYLSCIQGDSWVPLFRDQAIKSVPILSISVSENPIRMLPTASARRIRSRDKVVISTLVGGRGQEKGNVLDLCRIVSANRR